MSDTHIPEHEPLVPPGQIATPGDSMRLIAQGGPAVEKVISVSGKEKFEYMVLYCLKLLHPSHGICAFYIDDFDDCDEHTLKVCQRLIGRSGYVTSDFVEPDSKKYKGFWAWKPKGTA